MNSQKLTWSLGVKPFLLSLFVSDPITNDNWLRVVGSSISEVSEFICSPRETHPLLESLIGITALFGLETSWCSGILLIALASWPGNFLSDFNASSDTSVACEDENQHNSSSLPRDPNPKVESLFLQDQKNRYQY